MSIPSDLARAERSLTRLDELFGLFGETPPAHRELASEQVPEPYRGLLDHERHMTVTLEKHYRTTVQLEVLSEVHAEPFYARKILLREQDGEVIQFGLMRFDLRRVQAEVREKILNGQIPLGRILIEHDVLRRISTHGLLSLEPSADMRTVVGSPDSPSLYGRLATILCNESPAVDLLEVLTAD